jgi:hypothetical protein
VLFSSRAREHSVQRRETQVENDTVENRAGAKLHLLFLLSQLVHLPQNEERGGGEIRTHETFRPSGFQDRRNQPLCHPSRPGAHSRSETHYYITLLLQVKIRSGRPMGAGILE